MSNDLRDRLLTWLSLQEAALRKRALTEFEKGQIDTIHNTVAFILTDGQIR